MSSLLRASQLQLSQVHLYGCTQAKRILKVFASGPFQYGVLIGKKNAESAVSRPLQVDAPTHAKSDAVVALPKSSTTQFYRRPLPECCTPFSSEKGKLLFKESLLGGHANIYFRLAEQFHTQDEPAYCGVSTLVMVLNSLEVDPKRVWKGVWRWYHEGMLQCCVPLDIVQENGVTLDQFVCLATCNSLDIAFTRVDNSKNVDDFRRLIRDTCANDNKVMVCSYSRKIVGQTGDGHFSPIGQLAKRPPRVHFFPAGAYHPNSDSVLILDVARFKYPPHWISVDLLWKAMRAIDHTTVFAASVIALIGLPRGYILLKKTEEMPLILFRMSTTFRVTIGTGSLSGSTMARFLHEWQAFLESPIENETRCKSFDSTAEIALSALNEVLSALLVTDSIFTTQVNMCCLSSLSVEHRTSIIELVMSLEKTSVYNVVQKWVEASQQNRAEMHSLSVSACSRLDRVGVSATAKEVSASVNADHQSLTSRCDISRNKLRSHCDHSVDTIAEVQIGVSHFLTLLLLCWPFHQCKTGTYASCLHVHVERAFSELGSLLQNEVKQLRMQISSLLSMVHK